MTVKAIESQGVTLQYTVGSPSGMAGIANVTSFSGPGGSASVIDVTNLSSTAKEKLMGLPDEGQFSIDINFDPDDSSHQALRGARVSRTRTEFKINFTDSTPASATFWGYVLGFAISGAVDQQVKAAITIEIDGPVTWA
jgi:acetylornithine deacetylase/succinyl-diaminopimelate desuccinylase-like protein